MAMRILGCLASAVILFSVVGGPAQAGDSTTFVAIDRLLDPDGAAGDLFGWSVALDGDLMVIGAIDDSFQGNVDAGSVSIFERSGGSGEWEYVTKLRSPRPLEDRVFGVDVAIDGDLVVVSIGGPFGTDEIQYVFERDPILPDQWNLIAEVSGRVDVRGLALSGDTLVVGRPSDDGNRGTVSVFERDFGGPDAWGEIALLFDPAGEIFDRFGLDVDIEGDTIVVGSPFDEDCPLEGTVFVYERNLGGPDAWGQAAKIPNDCAEAQKVGNPVALHGDVLVSSSLNDSVTVFRRDLGGAGAWGVETVIQRGELEMFGNSIDLGDDLLVVGAEDVVSVYDARAAWTPVAELRPPLADMMGDSFGDGALQAVGNEVIVGVPGDDLAGANSGSALVYVPTTVNPIAKIIGSCPNTPV